MKGEFGVVVFVSVLVLLLGFAFFNSGGFGITGEVVLNSSEAEAFLGTGEIENFSREEVLVVFAEAEVVMKEMIENNFSVVYMNDNLDEAKRIFQQVDYAEMLRGNLNATDKERGEARLALALISWRDLEYGDVMGNLNEVVDRRDIAFEIYDGINVAQKNLGRYDEISPRDDSGELDLSEAEGFLDDARVAFYEDRYDDAEIFLEDVRESLDLKNSEYSVLGGLQRGLTSFFQKYWVFILLIFILLIVLVVVFYKEIRRHFLKKRIFKMKAEVKVLGELKKKVQTERFKENKISGLVYNIRMRKYEEKLGMIKRMLPVFEKRMKGRS